MDQWKTSWNNSIGNKPLEIKPTIGEQSWNNSIGNKLLEINATIGEQQSVRKEIVLARLCLVSKGAKIRNRYNQVPHLTQDTNGKVTNSQLTPQTRAKRSALSQQVTTKHI